MIGGFGFVMLVALVLAVVGAFHIVVASYRMTTAIGAIVVAVIVGLVIDFGISLGAASLVLSGHDFAEIGLVVSPMIGVFGGWIAGLKAT